MSVLNSPCFCQLSFSTSRQQLIQAYITALVPASVLTCACLMLCPSQEHGSILPMLIAAKTAQPAALTPLAFINEGLEQMEKLAAANLKGGVFQGALRYCLLCKLVWGGSAGCYAGNE